MDHEDQTNDHMELLTVAAQNTITHWSDTRVRGHLKEHPDYVLHDLALIEDMVRTVRAMAEGERSGWGELQADPHEDFEDQVDDYRAHSCNCDYCFQQEVPDPDEFIYEPFTAPEPARVLTPCVGCGRPQWNAEGSPRCHDCRKSA